MLFLEVTFGINWCCINKLNGTEQATKIITDKLANI